MAILYLWRWNMSTDNASLFFYIFIALLLVLAAIAIVAVIVKIKSFSRSAFGTDSLGEMMAQQRQMMSETPRSLHGMTSVYLPMIEQDFPEFDYALYKEKAEALLRSYFTAVSTKKTSALAEECSLTLKNNVQSIIESLNTRNVTQMFDNTVIHNTQIARYIKNGSTVTIMFESAVGYFSYITDDSGRVVFGDKNNKTQTVYEIGLVYVQNADKVQTNEAWGVNCPNCGAPVKTLGAKHCEYCGSGIVEINRRVWKFDSVHEQTVQGRQY
jgi:hypothetical protein